jgi:hypothetical protein
MPNVFPVKDPPEKFEQEELCGGCNLPVDECICDEEDEDDDEDDDE